MRNFSKGTADKSGGIRFYPFGLPSLDVPDHHQQHGGGNQHPDPRAMRVLRNGRLGATTGQHEHHSQVFKPQTFGLPRASYDVRQQVQTAPPGCG